jgi:hypothetical protein
MEEQIIVVRNIFDLTSTDNWMISMPFIIRSLPHPMWKVRFVKTFVWAMPSRAQEIGLMLHRGLDSISWAFISEQIPEIIPRGLPGHKRIY